MRSFTAALLLLVYGVTSFELNIDPAFKVINDRDNITVMCRASAKLADCQFTWWDLDDDEIPVSKFDFHLGLDSDVAYLVNGSEVNWRLAGYRYVGVGLDTGECGIQLFGLKVRFRMLSCRARELGKGWKYAYMTIKGNVSTQLQFSPVEQAPVVLPGHPFTIKSEADNSIKNCSFRFKDMNPIVFTSNRMNLRANNTCKRGQNGTSRPCQQVVGVMNGNDFWITNGPPIRRRICTITVRNVTDNINGLVYFEAWTDSGHYDRRVFHLTVAEAPSNGTLHVPMKPVVENELFEATCNVGLSRPLANITWYLGDTVIRQDSLDDSSEENHNDSPWRWDHELHSLSQTVLLRAGKEVQEKGIKCVVTHVALPDPVVLIQRVNFTSLDTKVTCPPVPPRNDVDMECWTGNRQVSCSSPMEVGSVVKMSLKCPQKTPQSQGNMTCLATGEWKKPSLKCLQGCGKSRLGVQTKPSHGKPLVQGQFPWHVSIYKLKGGRYEQVCTGSLLSLTTIVTAASCFIKNVWEKQNVNISSYKVAAAKINRSWNEEEENVQKRAVASLSVAPYFGGEGNNYNYNLAFLKVSEPFERTEDVGPVCFDRNLDSAHQLRSMAGKFGILPGWGLAEEDRPGSTLKAVHLHHVDSEICAQLVEPAARRLVMVDIFCAGSTAHDHGFTVCESDYGAGIVFIDDATENYYLRGVASVAFKPPTNKETCYPANLLNFATFFSLDNWLKQNLG